MVITATVFHAKRTASITEDRRPIISVCVETRAEAHWFKLTETPIQKQLIPSVARSVTKRERQTYNVRLYVAIDNDDVFWKDNHALWEVPEWLTVITRNGTLSHLMKEAIKHGSEYLVTVRDNEESFTKGWITAGVKHAKETDGRAQLEGRFIPVFHTRKGYDRTTVVLMGYSPKRYENYARLLKAYGAMNDVLDQIIMVWNNQVELPPKIPVQTKVPITVVQTERNTLNNRFNVSHIVRTSSVLTQDDDVLLNVALIRRLLDSHLREPSRLIGVDGRAISPEGTYLFKEEMGLPSMVLTKTMIQPISQLQAYMRNQGVLDYVDRNWNGEDIAMNMVAIQATGLPALVLSIDRKHRLDLPEHDGLSVSKRKNILFGLHIPNALVTNHAWHKNRTECTKWMLKHFHICRGTLLPMC